MFSVQQKREIAEAVQKILRATNHPELPATEIRFHLHVDGAESWSWADIRNNGAVTDPGVNPWNEEQAARTPPPCTCSHYPVVEHDLGCAMLRWWQRMPSKEA